MKRARWTPRSRVGVVGKTGQGKSNWIKERLAELVAEGVPVAAFDPLDELSVMGLQTSEVKLGPLTQRCTVAELEADDGLLDAPDLALAVVPEGSTQKEIAEEFETFARLVKATGDLVAVVEELGIFAEFCQSTINLVATTYRHYGVALVLSAQRMTQIPKTARAQLSEIVAFRTDDDDDRTWLAKVTRSDEFAERVSRLQPGEFEHWRDDVQPKSAEKPTRRSKR